MSAGSVVDEASAIQPQGLVFRNARARARNGSALLEIVAYAGNVARQWRPRGANRAGPRCRLAPAAGHLQRQPPRWPTPSPLYNRPDVFARLQLVQKFDWARAGSRAMCVIVAMGRNVIPAHWFSSRRSRDPFQRRARFGSKVAGPKLRLIVSARNAVGTGRDRLDAASHQCVVENAGIGLTAIS
jgi:hypothetical protein